MSSLHYNLRDIRDDRRIVAIFEIEKHYGSGVDGVCKAVNSWSLDGTPMDFEYFAEVYCKWDACTHWYFHGEDYDPSTDDENDSYYHLCGAPIFSRHIQCMCFIWKVVADLLFETGSSPEFTKEYYYEAGVEELINFILKDYMIEKIEMEGVEND